MLNNIRQEISLSGYSFVISCCQELKPLPSRQTGLHLVLANCIVSNSNSSRPAIKHKQLTANKANSMSPSLFQCKVTITEKS